MREKIEGIESWGSHKKDVSRGCYWWSKFGLSCGNVCWTAGAQKLTQSFGSLLSRQTLKMFWVLYLHAQIRIHNLKLFLFDIQHLTWHRHSASEPVPSRKFPLPSTSKKWILAWKHLDITLKNMTIFPLMASSYFWKWRQNCSINIFILHPTGQQIFKRYSMESQIKSKHNAKSRRRY